MREWASHKFTWCPVPATSSFSSHASSRDGQDSRKSRTYLEALISGLARNWSTRMSAWTLDDFLREWGEQPVTVAFSRDEKFQRGVAHPTEGRVVLAPDRRQLPFKQFVALQREQQSRAAGPVEHIAVPAAALQPEP